MSVATPSVMERWLSFQIELHDWVQEHDVDTDSFDGSTHEHVGAVTGSAAPVTDRSAGESAGEGVLTFLRRLAIEPSRAWGDSDGVRLRGIKSDRLSHDELVEFVGVLNRAKAQLDAIQLQALAVLDRRDPSSFQTVREEVACMLAISPPAAAKRLAQACAVVDHLPAAFAALEAGDISLAHLGGLARITGQLDQAIVARSTNG